MKSFIQSCGTAELTANDIVIVSGNPLDNSSSKLILELLASDWSRKYAVRDWTDKQFLDFIDTSTSKVYITGCRVRMSESSDVFSIWYTDNGILAFIHNGTTYVNANVERMQHQQTRVQRLIL